jgi:hypothetical protein
MQLIKGYHILVPVLLLFLYATKNTAQGSLSQATPVAVIFVCYRPRFSLF